MGGLCTSESVQFSAALEVVRWAVEAPESVGDVDSVGDPEQPAIRTTPIVPSILLLPFFFIL